MRLIGRTLTWIEGRLRDAGLDGYGGGIAALRRACGAVARSVVTATASWRRARRLDCLAWLVHAFLLYSLLALGDLLHHVWRIETAVRAGDLRARASAVSALVGRDTDRMDAGACRRAAVESLSENLTDGFVSPVFWYVLAGLPGIVALQGRQHDGFDGWLQDAALSPLRLVRREARRCDELPAGADDVAGHRGDRRTCCRRTRAARRGRVGLRQHAAVAGPELRLERSGHGRSAERRIVGPIWLNGVQVTDLWIGDAVRSAS